jgi:anti-anti-sigma factor
MNLVGSSFFTVADRTTLPKGGPGAGSIVVWLRGEYDLSTDEALSKALARAIALGSTALVLDLSEVGFIAVSTLRVIVRAQRLLQHQSRSLTVRSPSPCARRAIGACGLNDLLSSGLKGLITELPAFEGGRALGTWVEVPSARQAAAGPPKAKVPEGEGRLARRGR